MAYVMGHILLSCGLLMNMLDVEILSGNKVGKRAFLSIIKLKANVSPRFLFVLSRKHLSVRLSFAITTNVKTGTIVRVCPLFLLANTCDYYVCLYNFDLNF